MDVFEALLADDELFANGWGGFGIAIQAYQKRAVPLCDWVVEAARAHGRKLMVRLVKGAYWDTEVKPLRSLGWPIIRSARARSRPTFPILPAPRSCSPRATSSTLHSPRTTPTRSAQVKALAEARPFEFQRLHGMGEELYEELAKLETRIGDAQTPVRIYAPVGSHKELLAYLVRRLLENGANSSFVNRIADEQVSIDELVRDPVAELEALSRSVIRRSFCRSELFGGAPQQRRGRSQRPVGARAVAGAAEEARSPQLDREAGHRKRRGEADRLAP